MMTKYNESTVGSHLALTHIHSSDPSEVSQCNTHF